jgi:hypothetical protein
MNFAKKISYYFSPYEDLSRTMPLAPNAHALIHMGKFSLSQWSQLSFSAILMALVSLLLKTRVLDSSGLKAVWPL